MNGGRHSPLLGGVAPVPPALPAHPLVLIKDHLGLSVPVLQALRPSISPCVCGRCAGVSVQFEARFHFGPGGLEPIERRDAAPVVAPTSDPTS